VSLRLKTITLGGAAFASALFCAFWLHPAAIVLPSPPPSLNQSTAAPPPRRLAYRFTTTWARGAIHIVNNEPFVWNDVHVEIMDERVWFQCPALLTVGSGHTLNVQSRFCRAADGHIPMRLCAVHVAAAQGDVRTNLEPCEPVP
jgi:hypothetical protein